MLACAQADINLVIQLATQRALQKAGQPTPVVGSAGALTMAKQRCVNAGSRARVDFNLYQ